MYILYNIEYMHDHACALWRLSPFNLPRAAHRLPQWSHHEQRLKGMAEWHIAASLSMIGHENLNLSHINSFWSPESPEKMFRAGHIGDIV